MWQAEGREQTGPEPFDDGYRKEASGNFAHDPDKANRAASFLALTGALDGKVVLDIGGGTTMWPLMLKTAQYDLVDFSEAACELVYQQLLAAKGDGFSTHCWDAVEWLKANVIQYDVTLCFGTVSYLPLEFLPLLFERCPSPVLCVADSLGEGYLRYPTRITALCRDDLHAAARQGGWAVAVDLPGSDHFHMRFER